MMSQRQLYEFVYEKLKENLEENEISIIHPEENIMFAVDDQNFKLHVNTGDYETDCDYIWQLGIERYVRVTNEPEENEIDFKKKFINEMKQVEDHLKYINEFDFFNDGLNEFLMMTF